MERILWPITDSVSSGKLSFWGLGQVLVFAICSCVDNAIPHARTEKTNERCKSCD